VRCGTCGFSLSADDRACLSCGAQFDLPMSCRTETTPITQDARKEPTGSPRDDIFINRGNGLALRCHVGIKHHPNEDYGVVGFELVESSFYRWLVVSDGVSNSEQADRASEVACVAASESLREAVRRKIPAPQAVQMSIVSAQRSVLQIPFTGSSQKDSRVYSIIRHPHGLVANLLTRDHSYANKLLDSGQMYLEEAMRAPGAHAITRSLGILDEGEKLDPGICQVSLKNAVYLLACTDGLWNYVHPVYLYPADTLAEIAAGGPDDPASLAYRLVDHANQCGGQDNITVAVAMLQGLKNE